MGHLIRVLWLRGSHLCHPDVSAPICTTAVQIFGVVTSLHGSNCGAIFPSPPQSSAPLLCCAGEFPGELVTLILCEFSIRVAPVSPVPPSFCAVLCCREFWIVFDLVPLRVLSRCAACGFVPCVDLWRSQSKCQCTYFRYSKAACLPVPALCPGCC